MEVQPTELEQAIIDNVALKVQKDPFGFDPSLDEMIEEGLIVSYQREGFPDEDGVLVTINIEGREGKFYVGYRPKEDKYW